MTHNEITRPFGDDEYRLALTIDGVREREKAFERSLFATHTAMLNARDGEVWQVREIVRLALVGGGMSPAEAVQKVKTYIEQRPLSETFTLSLEITDAFFFGNAKYQAEKSAKGPA